MESSYPSLELRSAPCRPNTDHILRCEEDQQEAFLEIKTIAPQRQSYASFLGSYHVDEFRCDLLFVFTDGADHADDQAEEHDEKPGRIQNIELAAASRCSSSTITRHTMQQDNDCQANRSLTIAPLHGGYRWVLQEVRMRSHRLSSVIRRDPHRSRLAVTLTYTRKW